MNQDELKFRFDVYCHRMRNSGVKTVLREGVASLKEIAEAVVEPTPTNIVKAAMSVASTLTGGDLYTSVAFPPGEWAFPFPSLIYDQLATLLTPHMTTQVALNGSDHWLKCVILPGAKVAWSVEPGAVVQIGVAVDVAEQSVDFVRELLWREVNPQHVVLTADRQGDSDYDVSLRIATDDIVDGKPSDFATSYAAYMERCLDRGVRRTVLFYGPPGTGKSTIARMLCELSGLRSLRIRVEDVGRLSNGQLVELLGFFEPDVVIFDDLDRAGSQDALLETLQNLHNKVKFVFATANNIQQLDDALLRPGRFDEIIPIRKLDPAAVMKALGEYTDAFDDVKDWPIAFVNEYVIRRGLLGKEQAKLALDELRERVTKLEQGVDE
jgi:hypothetical protein